MNTLTAKLHREVGEKTLFFGLLAVLLAVLVPMLIMAGYNVPSADDYMAGEAHQIWEQSHSLIALWSWNIRTTVDNYLSWQGQGSSSILLVGFSNPVVFGEQWYFLTTYVMLGSLLGGSFCLIWTVFHKILGMSGWKAAIVWIIFSAAATQLLPWPMDAFYWWSGACMYTFFFGLSLFLYAQIAAALFGKKAASKGKRVLSFFCMVYFSALTGGGNFASALLAAMLYVIAIAVMLWTKRGDKVKILVSAAAFFISFAAIFSAPGNVNRQSVKPDALATIWTSLQYALRYARDWLTPLLLCLMAFLIPLLWQLAGEIKYRFRFPYVFALGSFGLYAAMFCPHLYAGGMDIPSRYRNVVYFAFVLLLIFNLFYFLGWLRKTLGEGKKNAGYSVGFLLLWACAFAGAFALTFREQNITSYRAASELVHGNAANYRRVNEERFALLKDPTKKVVVLPRYDNPAAYTVYNGDIADEPSYWRDAAMADYYGKDLIRLEEWEPGKL